MPTARPYDLHDGHAHQRGHERERDDSAHERSRDRVERPPRLAGARVGHGHDLDYLDLRSLGGVGRYISP